MPRTAFRLPPWATDGLLLTAANFGAAAGNYLFQAIMRRHLAWSEFGYLNTTLSLVTLAAVPLAAASQTLVHRLAADDATGNAARVRELQAASLKVLRGLSWILLALSLVLVVPVAGYLRFPRMDLAWIGLAGLPVALWSMVGAAWCSGLSRFRLLAGLMLLGTAARVALGALAVEFYPWAEAGVGASIAAGLVLASVAVFSRHHATAASIRALLLQREWLVYGAAALALSVGSYLLIQGDQLLAQRAFGGDDLGRYTGAGLLGRSAIWGSAPLLTVYFTRRSARHPSLRAAAELLAAYLLLFAAGVAAVVLLRGLLLRLLLGAYDPQLGGLTARFALSIVPVGVLQAIGCRYLALRRIPECFLYGACGLLYFGALSVFGRTPFTMLECMAAAGTGAIALLGLFSLARRFTRPPGPNP